MCFDYRMHCVQFSWKERTWCTRCTRCTPQGVLELRKKLRFDEKCDYSDAKCDYSEEKCGNCSSEWCIELNWRTRRSTGLAEGVKGGDRGGGGYAFDCVVRFKFSHLQLTRLCQLVMICSGKALKREMSLWDWAK